MKLFLHAPGRLVNLMALVLVIQVRPATGLRSDDAISISLIKTPGILILASNV
jgi:hypothetical protein